MKKSAYMIRETREEAKTRVWKKILRATRKRAYMRLKSDAGDLGIPFEEVFDVDIDEESYEVRVFQNHDVEFEHFRIPITQLASLASPETMRAQYDLSYHRTCAIIEDAINQSTAQKKRIEARATRYARRFPVSRQISARTDGETLKLLKSASGPLAYAGPRTVHEVDELVAKLFADAPWLQTPLSVIWTSLKVRMAEDQFFGLTPTLLVGAHGTGKSTLARHIAKNAGIHHVEIDAGAGTSAMRIAGVEAGWASRQIGEVFRSVIDSRSPNPMIIINEIDKIGSGQQSSGGYRTSMSDALLPLLERSTAQHFRCPATGVTVDLGDVSFVLTANNIEAIDPVLLSRMRVIHIPRLTIDDVMSYIETHHGDLDQRTLFDLQMAIIRGWSRAVTLRHIERIISELKSENARPLLH
ncbi:ATP-binding protein [Tritonibacter mobilis]|uniref:ATP-binding protein n=1 Tax=Tritonibacter mobilis TaxID=379347 RepID=UPI000E0DEC71|nr:ATP-binding protein [Tritonibacter mobilis]